jgi:hypothetical protein
MLPHQLPDDEATARQWVAPCGINCYNCSSHARGLVTTLAQALQESLAGFETMLPAFAEIFPIYKDYDKFNAILADLAEEKCPGCRSGTPNNADCQIYRCDQLSPGGLCADCSQFPCDKADEAPFVKGAWVSHTKQIQAQGLLEYWRASKANRKLKRE